MEHQHTVPDAMATYSVSVGLLITPDAWPRWLVMWLLAFAIYAVCKLLSWQAAGSINGVPHWRHWAYLVAWPGLDAARFLDPLRPPEPPTASEWLAGAAKTLLGAFLFWTAERWIPSTSPIVLGWAGLVGAGFMLHFGLFHLLSCFWRAVGVDARPLMVEPLKATSVTDFWSNRWNTAFRDFTHRFLFGPLARRCGLTTALFGSFFASGLIHDLVISAPAGGGYGKPTLFFLIQPLAMLVERSRDGRRLGLGRGWRGWAFTAVALLAPARLLFHDQFILAVVVPFMKALGAA